VDTATAMKIVGHKSEKMWKRYNAIEERDLTLAAQKVHKYLQENIRILPYNALLTQRSVAPVAEFRCYGRSVLFR
jgi:hypothetical protein